MQASIKMYAKYTQRGNKLNFYNDAGGIEKDFATRHKSLSCALVQYTHF